MWQIVIATRAVVNNGMLEIRDLELVVTIVREGNFACASRLLGPGAPVLSRRMADLEHRLGNALFVRGKGGVKPTSLCRALMTDADEILDRMQALQRRLAATRGPQTEALRVVAGSYVCETSVLAAAGDLLGRRPRLHLTVTALNWSGVAGAVREREAELGVLEISSLGDAAGDLVIEPLGEHSGFFAARAGHPLAKRERLTLADILAYPLIHHGQGMARYVARFAAAREAARAAGPTHDAFPALQHESPSLALRAVAVSDAVVGVTAPMVDSAMRAGAITVLPWQEPWAYFRFGIVQARGRRLSPAAGHFAEALRKADKAAQAEGERMLARVEVAKAGGGLPPAG